MYEPNHALHEDLGPARVVLDTDTYNEIDDQFALSYLLRSPDRVAPEAIYAAPFLNHRSTSAADGMNRSFEEIRRLLERLHMERFPSFRGCEGFLREVTEEGGETRMAPHICDASADLVDRAMTASESDRLNIVAIGALTNVAVALITEPAVAERCTLTWLGGHSPSWPHNQEFNLQGDIPAAQVVFDSGIPLRVVPCMGVASHMLTSEPELRRYLDLEDPLSKFLFDRYVEYGPATGVWTKEIWDVAAVAWLVLPAAVKSVLLATPRIAADGSYIPDPRRPPARFAYELDRDAIFADLFRRLSPQGSRDPAPS